MLALMELRIVLRLWLSCKLFKQSSIEDLTMSKKMVSFIGDVLRRLIGRIVINPHKPLPMPLPTPWQWIEFRFFHGLIRRRIERDVDQTKSNYATQLIRIREKIQSGKQVRVLFLVSEISKWKGKSLYFALQQDSLFYTRIFLESRQF